MAFSLEAKLFRGWRASVEQRQAGSLRVGCGLRAAGCWLLVEPGGADAGSCADGVAAAEFLAGLAGLAGWRGWSEQTI